MKTIRKNVFESNSSSMHAVTVPVEIKNWQVIHDYVVKNLERFKISKNKYEIVFDVKTENMDGEDFSIRRYIPHYSIVDKAFYVIATIVQHYGLLLGKNEPYDSSVYKTEWARKEKDKKEKERLLNEAKKAHEEYLVEKAEYVKKYGEANKVVLDKFVNEIRDLESQLTDTFKMYLCDRPRRIDEDDWQKSESYNDYIKKVSPEVNVSIKYDVDDEMNTFCINKDDYGFSTGCYDNEEFYYAVCRNEYTASDWLVNPFAAILAGSDEQGMLDSYKQEEDANRLLEEAWELAPDYESKYPDLTDEEIEEEVNEHCYTWDDSPRAQALLKDEKNELREFLKSHRGKKKRVQGNIIWPIGG